MNQQNLPIEELVRKRCPDLFDKLFSDISFWYDEGLKKRREVFGEDVTELEHCQRELDVQMKFYDVNINQIERFRSTDFELCLIFQQILRKRRELIIYINARIVDEERKKYQSRLSGGISLN